MPSNPLDAPEDPSWIGPNGETDPEPYEPYDDDDQPVFEEGPDEDVIPLTEQPVAHVNWMCSGVTAVSLKKKAPEPHMLPTGSKPSQPTTDASGLFMAGGCPECGTSTIWKKVTL